MKQRVLIISLGLSILLLNACSKKPSEPVVTAPVEENLAPQYIEGDEIEVTTFDNVYFDAGTGHDESFLFPSVLDSVPVKKVWMSIFLTDPSSDGHSLSPWDVFGRISTKVPSPADPTQTVNLELGRFITPYLRENTSLPNGFLVDVTDFKDILKDSVNLNTFVESYSGGWNLKVIFKFVLGEPDYKYYAIAPIMNFNGSAQVLRYGKGPVGQGVNGYQDLYTIKVPESVEQTSIRTIITGWGNAAPRQYRWDDAIANGYAATTPTSGGYGNFGYAEFAYTSHHILINNGSEDFLTYMGPLGCGGANPDQVQNQAGTWAYQRAGWCPGMVVPVRSNVLNNPYAGQSFNYQFQFEPWEDDGTDQGGAYFSLSSYVVVKSNSPIAFATDYLQ